jgi:lipopolysaccharide/colanic/teichoic acid biosynthesis glycosyltransferase
MKRWVDLLCSLLALGCLLPIMALIAGVVRRDGGPVFFRQVRIGQNGRPFRLIKFRTMVLNAEAMGAQVTAGRDPRITRVGAILRKTKLDELPQLFNILRGEMSIVGPRPEVPRYVQIWGEENRQMILRLKPGLTDFAAILFRNEEAILADSDDPEKTYIYEIMPQKLALYRQYAKLQRIGLDFRLILSTLLILFGVTPDSFFPEISRLRFQPSPVANEISL